MTVLEFMVAEALRIAADDSYGYSNCWPNNKFGEGADPKNGDCGAFCSYCLNQALAQIGISTNEYFEPMSGSLYNKEYLLKYCDKYDYQTERNQVGDILVSAGHTVMVTACGIDWYADTITHASDNYDGISGDSTGRDICSCTLWDNGWYAIYRLKPEYANQEIGEKTSADCSCTFRVWDSARGILPAVTDGSIETSGNLRCVTADFADGLHKIYAYTDEDGWYTGVTEYDPEFIDHAYNSDTDDGYAGDKSKNMLFFSVSGSGYKYRAQISHDYWLPWVYSRDCDLTNFDTGCAGDGLGPITGLEIRSE